MTKRQAKRRAFLTSIMSLTLCVAMLVGSTFSWFTDSTSNTGNRIVTGELIVELHKYDGEKYKRISDGVGDIFATEEGKEDADGRLNGTLWEPGKTEVVLLQVENAGDLALNYNIVLDVKNETEAALENVLSYAIIPNMDAEAYEAAKANLSWANILSAGYENGKVPVGTTIAAPNGALSAKESDYFALVVHMDESAGNEYQKQSISIDVKVEAEQKAEEYDSFGNQYDANSGVTEFGTNLVASSTPNAETVLWKEFALSDYAATNMRMGYTEDGEQYMLFVQQYYMAKVRAWSPTKADANDEDGAWVMLTFDTPTEINEVYLDFYNGYSDGDPGRPADYVLEGNTGTADAPNWVTIKEDTDNPQNYISAIFDTLTVTQVRLTVTRCDSVSSLSGDASTDRPRLNGFNVYKSGSLENLALKATPTASTSANANLDVSFVLKNYNSQDISCITAVDLDGNILWQTGTPDAANFTCGEDLPVEIYDIDGDGADEIITVYNNHILIMAPDGTIEKTAPCGQVSADSIVICNVSGDERATDLIIKDRHWEMAVYNSDLELQWTYHKDKKIDGQVAEPQGHLIGHYPAAYDLNGDGIDELILGHEILNADGSLYASMVHDTMMVEEHVDCVRVLEMNPDNPGVEIITEHSNSALNFFNDKGEILVHDLQVGHAQKPGIGEFMPTIEGLEIFTFSKKYITEFTSLHLHKANGERIWPEGYYYIEEATTAVNQIEPSSFILAGSGQEYLLQTYKYHEMIDAYNNKIVEFPEEAVNRFGMSVNICGDGREELLFWDDEKVQIWTNAAVVPDGGKNLALGATVTTSSTLDGYDAAALVDGDRTNTLWVSKDSPDEHYIIVDLGAVKTFDELWLYGCSDENVLENFKIQYNAGTTKVPQWVDIVDVVSNMKKEAAFTFDPVTAQQVRILITDPTTVIVGMDSTARVCEIEIYEALSGVFTAVDGEKIAEDGAQIIDFGKNVVVDAASISFSGEVRGYTLQYNSGTADAPVWTDLASAVANTISVNNYAFTPVSTSALRVIVTEGSGEVMFISAREYSGYAYQEVVNELIVNPTKVSYKDTNY